MQNLLYLLTYVFAGCEEDTHTGGTLLEGDYKYGYTSWPSNCGLCPFVSQSVILELLITMQFNQPPDTNQRQKLLLSLLPNLNVYPRHSRQFLDQVRRLPLNSICVQQL